MLSKEENIFAIYVLDCGFYTRKAQGLFSKLAPRRGIGYPRPLDQGWMIQIRSRGLKRNLRLATVPSVAAPWPDSARTCQSSSILTF
jgi:hypothetical protein